MDSGPITLWQVDGETIETVTDYIFLGTKITADSEYNFEIKRHVVLLKEVITNLESILKSRDMTLLTKVCIVKCMYRCECWIMKKGEFPRIDAFKLGAGEDS